MEPCKIWVEQCEAARMIEDEFGTDKALRYLVGEKFLNYLEAAETAPRLPGGTPRLRRRDQDDLRALATCRVPGDGTTDRAVRPRHLRGRGRRDHRDGTTETTFDAPPPTCCWSNVPRSGCWGTGTGSPGPIRRVLFMVTTDSELCHRKTNDVRVARQGLSPLSGLITSRRWVTPWAETVHFSRSKVVPAGLKLYSCRSSSRYVLPPSQERLNWSSWGSRYFQLFNFHEDLVDRLWVVKGKDHGLLTRLTGDPAGASLSPMRVEGKVNGMVGSLGGHLHRGDGGDVDLPRGWGPGLAFVAG